MTELSEGNEYFLRELASNLSGLITSRFSVEYLGKRYDKKTSEMITEREIFSDPTADLTLPFLQIYAQLLESKAFTDLGKYEEDHRTSYVEELVRTYRLLRDVIKSKGDENLALDYDQKIVLTGDKANKTRPEYDKRIDQYRDLEVTLLAYELAEQDTTERKLQTAEALFEEWKKSKIFGGKEIISIYLSSEVEQAERIATKLNEMFTNSETIFDSFYHPSNIESLVAITTTIAKENPILYKALEQHLDNRLTAEVKYPGTEIFVGSDIEFKPIDPLEVLALIPTDWNFLRIYLKHPQAVVPLSSNRVINRIPLNLGLSNVEARKTYDKSQTLEVVERDGLYEDYTLAATQMGEVQIIREELLSILLKKGYGLDGVTAARFSMEVSEGTIDHIYVNSEEYTRTAISFGYLTGGVQRTIKLSTRRDFTTTEEVNTFAKNLELIAQEE